MPHAGADGSGGHRAELASGAAARNRGVESRKSANISTLGRRAVVGRTFGPEDTTRSQAAVLTDCAWRRHFASDPAVIGRQFLLDAQPIVIAGIIAPDDSLGSVCDIYLPIDESTSAFLDRAGSAAYAVIGRLRAGVSADVARAQVQAVVDRIAKSSPEGRNGHTVFVEDLRTRYTYSNWRPLYFFGGAVVVRSSTVNVATLLGRAVRRSRSLPAVRWAAAGDRSRGCSSKARDCGAVRGARHARDHVGASSAWRQLPEISSCTDRAFL